MTAGRQRAAMIYSGTIGDGHNADIMPNIRSIVAVQNRFEYDHDKP